MMQPFKIPVGGHLFMIALDAVAYYLNDPEFMVWYERSEVINATLYPIDKFWFHLADGRVLPVEQYDRVCIYRRVRVP